MCQNQCDSYCGLYCGACDVLIAHQQGEKSSFAAFWDKATLEKFQKAQGTEYDPEDLKLECHGCKSDNVFINCRSCRIKDCAIERNLEYCSDCEDYPCSIHQEDAKAMKILPHLDTKPLNLDTIKRHGSTIWTDVQEKRWECPECQTPYGWYSKNCNSCGTDLRDKTYKFGWFNGAMFRLAISMIGKQNKSQASK